MHVHITSTVFQGNLAESGLDCLNRKEHCAITPMHTNLCGLYESSINLSPLERWSSEPVSLVG